MVDQVHGSHYHLGDFDRAELLASVSLSPGYWSIWRINLWKENLSNLDLSDSLSLNNMKVNNFSGLDSLDKLV